MAKFDDEFIQYSNQKVKNETKHLALFFVFHITLYIVLFFFLIFFAWYTYFVTTHKFYIVKGVSMMSTLNGQITQEELLYDFDVQNKSYDAVYIDKFTKPRVFDIVVVERPNSKSAIKRLMAVEGDYITIAVTKVDGENRLCFYRIPSSETKENYTDEMALIEEANNENGYSIYSYEDWWTYKTSSGQTPQQIDVQVEEEDFSHQYEYNFYNNFLKNFDLESSDYYVSSEGLVYVKVPKGKVFYMGDNRGHSTDCRETGFCDAKYLVGRAEFIIHNYNFGNRILEVIKFYYSEVEKFFAR